MFYESATAAKYTGKTRFEEVETAFKPMNPRYILHGRERGQIKCHTRGAEVINNLEMFDYLYSDDQPIENICKGGA